MELQAIYPQPRTRMAAPDHKLYPDRLGAVEIIVGRAIFVYARRTASADGEVSALLSVAGYG
jgi:hypothetical protein